jgi:predicted dithiol-disulfide oxidoreductase (DUF899 family)
VKEEDMADHPVVSREEWLQARKQLLDEEKEFTRLRDALSARRRALPWMRVEKTYRFDGPAGAANLSDLFGPRKQLIVQHFMFAPDWEKPCKSCSFWADGYNGVIAHLAERDTAFAAVSRGPRAKLAARAERMGWTFPWYSSGESDFSYDFGASFRPEDLARGPVSYNYTERAMKGTDMPGVSTFIRDEDGAVYHTYSCFARGLDMMNVAYQYLDLTALGRHEEDLPFSMSWVKLRDEYAA